ncbi:Uncharacterised protein [Mycobacteroides abscessus subsp. abscessus]|nr:Uncharacterised protein [Mycobacteroides abscessus subsp. abscessus]
MAVPSEGMKASDMPPAATSEAGRTSIQKVPVGRISDMMPRPSPSTARPVTIIGFAPNRCIARGASTIMPSMIRVVIGSSAAPEGKAL